MMKTALLAGHKLFGLFEIDPAGTVLYSRTEPAESWYAPAPDMAGRNFFDEVAPFGNMDEFRRRIAAFTRGSSPADNFNFDCQFESGALPIRVLLARIREHSDGERTTKAILMHIRRSL